jgi:APA family basic amino acid/polyamine antiporter
MVLGKFVLLFTFLGVAIWNYPSRWPGLSPQVADTTQAFSLPAFCMSLVWISLSYCGFNASIYVASEVKDAKRNVPRSLLLGTLLVSLFYLALNAVFLFAPNPADITGQEQIAVIAARTVGGSWLAELIRWTVIVSLFTSVSVMIMTGPRVYAKMADDGLMPRWLRFQEKAPQAAILMEAILAIAVIYISTLKQLLSYLGFTLSLSSALTVASLFWIKPRAGQPLGVRLAAFVYVASTLFIATLAASKSPWEIGYGLLTILAGLLLYALIHKWR